MSKPDFPWSPMAERTQEGDPIAVIFGKVKQAEQQRGEDFLSLAAGPPPTDLLPGEAFVEVVQAQQNGGSAALNYGRPAGLPDLVTAWAAELSKEYEVVCENPMENALVTSGGMEGLALTLLALVKPGDKVLVESPAFPGMLAAIKLVGGITVRVECDDFGMLPEALETAIEEHGSRIVSLMPDFQNPSGRLMPIERRKAIADVLKRTDAFALEDGVYAPLRFSGEPLPALQSFAPDNVVYVSSVSKSIAPAERVGMVVARPELIRVLANMKSIINMQASNVLQGVAAAFIRPEGPLHAHLAEMLPRYADRCNRMAEAIATHLPGYTVVKPEGGMFLWVTGPEGVDFTDLLDDAIANGVAYVPGSLFYAESGVGHNQLRLNFASIAEEKIDEAIRRIALTVEQKRKAG